MAPGVGDTPANYGANESERGLCQDNLISHKAVEARRRSVHCNTKGGTWGTCREAEELLNKLVETQQNQKGHEAGSYYERYFLHGW